MAKWIKVLTGCVVAVLVFFLNGIEAGEHIPENRKQKNQPDALDAEPKSQMRQEAASEAFSVW